MGNNPATRRIGRGGDELRYSVYDTHNDHHEECDDFNEAVEICDQMNEKHLTKCFVYDAFGNEVVYETTDRDL